MHDAITSTTMYGYDNQTSTGSPLYVFPRQEMQMTNTFSKNSAKDIEKMIQKFQFKTDNYPKEYKKGQEGTLRLKTRAYWFPLTLIIE